MSVHLEARDWALMEGLSLASRRRHEGFAAGEQRSPALGGGAEFAEYRPYSPGDDLRLVDWDVFLRSRRLVTRLAAEERELGLVVLLDASPSMAAGGKLDHAKRLASIVAGAAVRGGNRVGLAVLGPELREALSPRRASPPLPELLRLIGSVGVLDCPSPRAAAAAFGARYGGKSLLLVISDFLFPEAAGFLALLGGSGAEGIALQVLARDELEPPWLGEATLVDLEDGAELPLRLGGASLAAYRETLEAELASTAAACARAGFAWGLAAVDRPPAELLPGGLRGRSWLC